MLTSVHSEDVPGTYATAFILNSLFFGLSVENRGDGEQNTSEMP